MSKLLKYNKLDYRYYILILCIDGIAWTFIILQNFHLFCVDQPSVVLLEEPT